MSHSLNPVDSSLNVAGEEFFRLCQGEESKVAEVNALLQGWSEDQRREAVRYKDVEVGESDTC